MHDCWKFWIQLEIEIMWTYQCEDGEYKENTLVSLLLTIFLHRVSHLMKGEGYVD